MEPIRVLLSQTPFGGWNEVRFKGDDLYTPDFAAKIILIFNIFQGFPFLESLLVRVEDFIKAAPWGMFWKCQNMFLDNFIKT